MLSRFIKTIVLLLFMAPIFGMTPPKHNLVDIKKINPEIITDIVYATKNNFTGQIIYTAPKCYALKEVAEALSNVQKELAKKGLVLKVWDAYRPMSAQQKFWDVLADKYPDEKERENYVANPKNGGRHTKATSADVTVFDPKTGKDLDMGTGFDHFGPEAWRTYQNLPDHVKQNRKLLEQVMEKYGFKGIKSEWWHFDFNGWEQCEPLKITFEQLD